jgi:hypothetical protein
MGYAYGSGTQANGGDRLFIGTGGETNNLANVIDVIGGKYFTNLLDHVHGTRTASSALIVDSNGKLDVLDVDNLKLDTNTLSSTNTNGNIILNPAGTGTIEMDAITNFASSATFTGLVNANAGIAVDTNKFTVADTTGNTLIAGTLGVTGETTLASAIVSDLTNNRITIAGTSGALEDDANFRFDGTNFHIGASGSEVFDVTVANGNTQITGTINVDGESTLASAVIEDLTNNRIVIAGVGGAIEDDSNLTFDGTTFTVAAATQLTGVATVTGQLNVDNIRVDANTISSTNTNGNIVLDPVGTGYVTITGTNGLVVPVGTNAQQGPNVAGAIRYNNENTQFEGYSGANWSSLGGVRSVDGHTHIIAETSPGNSDDTLHFYTATGAASNKRAMFLDEDQLSILNTTTSTSNTTGSLITAGGAGIAENLYVGGDTVLTGDLLVKGGDITTNQTTFNLVNTTATTLNIGGAGTAISIGASTGKTTINNPTDVTGSFRVGTTNFTVDASNGNVETAGNAIIGGDLTVNGTTTSVNTNTLDVEDALIRLASGNTADSVDIGFVGRYNDGADKFAGIYRDATSNEFYIFDELVDSNLTDNVITQDGTFVLADTNVKAIKFDQKSFSLTGDVAGTINMSDMGDTNHTMAVTIQANSVALGTDTTGNYIATIVQATGGATDNNSTTNNGLVITGNGTETAAVTLKNNLADAAGGIGTSTFNATNFDVSAGGVVTVDTIDGGTF